MIDIRQKGIYCGHALNDTPFKARPLAGGDDAWDQIERNDPFLTITVTIDVECDADASEEFFGLN